MEYNTMGFFSDIFTTGIAELGIGEEIAVIIAWSLTIILIIAGIEMVFSGYNAITSSRMSRMYGSRFIIAAGVLFVVLIAMMYWNIPFQIVI